MNNIYYVYRHIRLDTGLPFNIGKGKEGRAFSPRNRNLEWTEIVKKYGYRVEILISNLEENLAFFWERKLIDLYKKQNIKLVNKTNGGQGASGRIHTEETKKKLSIAHTGKVMGEDFKKVMSKVTKGSKNGMYGKSHKEDALQKMKKPHPGVMGKKNPNFNGFTITPKASFFSQQAAADFYKVSRAVIQKRLKLNKYPEWFLLKLPEWI